MINIAVLGLRGFPGVIGGVESHCELLYPALAARVAGLHFTIFMRHGVANRNRYPDQIDAVDVWSPRTFGVETFLHTLLSVLLARLRFHCEIVHLHGIGPAFFSPLARFLGAKVIVTHHAHDYDRPKWGWVGKRFLRIGENFAARYAHQIVCVSTSLRDSFLAMHPSAADRTIVIRHGLHDSEIMHHAEPTDLALPKHGYVLAAGRFDRTKRFEDVITAHRRANISLPLVVVGRSAGEPEYDAELEELKHPGLIFAGYRQLAEMRHLVRNAAVLVHASQMEGAGLVILEALGERTPVLLSDIPPHREFGLPPERYFALGDVDALAAKLARPFESENTEYFDRLERDYDFSKMYETYARLYRSFGPDCVPQTKRQ